MAKRGPKPGESKWRKYIIQRREDGLYYGAVNSHHVPQWVPREKAAVYRGINAARGTVSVLEASREPVRFRRKTRENWRIEDVNDPTWEAYWPW